MQTRRDFLTTTAAAASALALSGQAFAADAPKKRSIKKGIMYATVGAGKTVMEKFQAVKEAGFEGIEAMSHYDQEEVLKARDTTGLKIPSVCGQHHWAKPLSDPNPSVREQAVEALKQTLRDAKRY